MTDQRKSPATQQIPAETLLEWIAAIDHELGGDKRRASTMKRIKRSGRSGKFLSTGSPVVARGFSEEREKA